MTWHDWRAAVASFIAVQDYTEVLTVNLKVSPALAAS